MYELEFSDLITLTAKLCPPLCKELAPSPIRLEGREATFAAMLFIVSPPIDKGG